MCHRQEYRNQRSTHPSQANYRFNFQKTDFKQLYVLHYRSQGINISKHAEDNVHDWLNPHSPNFNIDIAKSVFHYSARVQHSDRFEAFISTKEMEDAAWSYVHNSQLILDGTFGVSSSRLLLWIAMGLDHQGKGLPVAMFLFSAPAGVLATHAGYDTQVLTHLLKTWKDWLSSRELARNRVFEPRVAITDTDAKERGALTYTWPSIVLLLCKFHMRQCWSNKRQAMLKRDSSLSAHVIERLRSLELS
jgi:MULE transposase domain